MRADQFCPIGESREVGLLRRTNKYSRTGSHGRFWEAADSSMHSGSAEHAAAVSPFGKYPRVLEYIFVHIPACFRVLLWYELIMLSFLYCVVLGRSLAVESSNDAISAVSVVIVIVIVIVSVCCFNCASNIFSSFLSVRNNSNVIILLGDSAWFFPAKGFVLLRNSFRVCCSLMQGY